MKTQLLLALTIVGIVAAVPAAAGAADPPACPEDQVSVAVTGPNGQPDVVQGQSATVAVTTSATAFTSGTVVLVGSQQVTEPGTSLGTLSETYQMSAGTVTREITWTVLDSNSTVVCQGRKPFSYDVLANLIEGSGFPPCAHPGFSLSVKRVGIAGQPLKVEVSRSRDDLGIGGYIRSLTLGSESGPVASYFPTFVNADDAVKTFTYTPPAAGTSKLVLEVDHNPFRTAAPCHETTSVPLVVYPAGTRIGDIRFDVPAPGYSLKFRSLSRRGAKIKDVELRMTASCAVGACGGRAVLDGDRFPFTYTGDYSWSFQIKLWKRRFGSCRTGSGRTIKPAFRQWARLYLKAPRAGKAAEPVTGLLIIKTAELDGVRKGCRLVGKTQRWNVTATPVPS